jgi:hypothetical protein
VPQELRSLVERCWAADFDERPEFCEIVDALEAMLATMPPDADEAVRGKGCCAIQ